MHTFRLLPPAAIVPVRKLFLLPLLLLPLFAPAPTQAASTPAPAWQVTDLGSPSVLSPGQKEGGYDVVVENVGAADSLGEFTVSIGIPAGLSVTEVLAEPTGGAPFCHETAGEVLCRFTETEVPSGFVVVLVNFAVTGEVHSLRSVAKVEGGGAKAPATSEASMRLGSKQGEKGPSGVSLFQMTATGPAGEPVMQAGGHPHFFTTQLLLNNMFDESANIPVTPIEEVKDLVFYLPLGMLGDPAVTEPCPASLVETEPNRSGCPGSSRVGTVIPLILDTAFADSAPDPTHEHGIYSVTPEKGYAAEFAFTSNNLTFVLYANVVRHDGAYMLRVAIPGLPAVAAFVGTVATFYGNIEEHSITGGEERVFERGAFLTDPSDCGEGAAAGEASVEFNTWDQPGASLPQSFPTFPGLEGCDALGFSAALTAAPEPRLSGDNTEADEPSGYKLNLQAPQAPDNGKGLGTPPYEEVDFTFPGGTALSPGAANGLTACAATGSHGIDLPSGTGTPGNPGRETGEGEEDGPEGLPRPVAGHCPGSSQVGTVSAISPILSKNDQELKGHLYLAEPECGNSTHPNPCTPEDAANGSLYRLYLELEQSEAGVIVKLPGAAHVNPSTGQVESVFEDTPQFPVSDLTIETSGGPRASLANPQTCGTATTTGLIAPWDGGAPAEPSSSFQVNEGCGTQAFNPVFTAGTSSPLAGAYSPFTLTLKREDREQDVNSLSTTLQEGLLATVSHVAQCPEPQASQGSCPESSHVGMTTVGIGSGSDPFYQTGQVYFTGPYDGAPFGLSVVVPAVAGPFNLGNVVVRVALRINQSTTQVTAESGPLPQIIDGVPLRIRTINVTLNNPAFTFNPTNCSRSSITGTVYSTQGAATGVSAPFEANGCQGLPFKPSFAASTAGKASKEDGASLVVRVASKGGPQTGEEANIKAVKVDLPEQLPSRLTTLHKACTEAQFDTNPAGCPKESDIGTATAVTPILANPLVGPAYLVSHGGAAFPDLEIVLQGEGVGLVLDGQTDIKNGVTSSAFKTVPDAPISSFELVLPTGPFSVLTANVPASAKYDLCGQSLSMPTEITGQNGAVVKQTTKIAITGCAKVKTKTLTRAQKLKKALKACKKKKGAKRASCEKAARKRFGPLKKSKRKKK